VKDGAAAAGAPNQRLLRTLFPWRALIYVNANPLIPALSV
jgi:hypothetical protein